MFVGAMLEASFGHCPTTCVGNEIDNSVGTGVGASFGYQSGTCVETELGTELGFPLGDNIAGSNSRKN
eukprot:scaffold3556_cov67-Attheya_sp.AAC.10